MALTLSSVFGLSPGQALTLSSVFGLSPGQALTLSLSKGERSHFDRLNVSALLTAI